MSETPPICVAVVDDDESVRRSLSRLLRAGGLQPINYASAEAFLADTKHPQFDCLLLDIQLGGMSGIELAQRLLAEGGHTPVIFITAHDDPETREEAEAAGCAVYFRKTDSGAEVLDAIRRVATRTARYENSVRAEFCDQTWKPGDVVKVKSTTNATDPN